MAPARGSGPSSLAAAGPSSTRSAGARRPRRHRGLETSARGRSRCPRRRGFAYIATGDGRPMRVRTGSPRPHAVALAPHHRARRHRAPFGGSGTTGVAPLEGRASATRHSHCAPPAADLLHPPSAAGRARWCVVEGDRSRAHLPNYAVGRTRPTRKRAGPSRLSEAAPPRSDSLRSVTYADDHPLPSDRPPSRWRPFRWQRGARSTGVGALAQGRRVILASSACRTYAELARRHAAREAAGRKARVPTGRRRPSSAALFEGAR